MGLSASIHLGGGGAGAGAEHGYRLELLGRLVRKALSSDGRLGAFCPALHPGPAPQWAASRVGSSWLTPSGQWACLQAARWAPGTLESCAQPTGWLPGGGQAGGIWTGPVGRAEAQQGLGSLLPRPRRVQAVSSGQRPPAPPALHLFPPPVHMRVRRGCHDMRASLP